MKASWWEDRLRGNLGFALMGGAMFSISLIQLSVNGWGCLPSMLFTWGQTIVEVMKIIAQLSSVQSVLSDSLRPHESQHARPPWPSQLPEFTQTHVRRVGDAIQPSHPLPPPSPPAPNPSQHQGLSQWVNSSHEVAKVLESQLQHQSFQRIPGTDLL